MGQQNCCGSRDNKQSKLMTKEDFANNQSFRPSSINRIQQQQQQKIQQKQEKTFGDLLIDDIIYETSIPINENWVILCETASFKLYAIEWKVDQNIIINVIRAEYLVKCNPQQFIEFMNTPILQQKFDVKMDCQEHFHKNEITQEYLSYLSYKNILLIKGRDFVYLKKIKQINKNRNIWCDASRSIEDEKYSNNGKNKQRGQINLSGHLVQKLNQIDNFKQQYSEIPNPEQYSLVKSFCDIDLRMNVSLKALSKQITNEYRQYVERCQKYFIAEFDQKQNI